MDFTDPEDEEELLEAYQQFIYTSKSLNMDSEVVEATMDVLTKSQKYVNELIEYLQRNEGHFLTFDDAWVTYWSPPSEGKFIQFSIDATSEQLANYLAAVVTIPDSSKKE